MLQHDLATAARRVPAISCDAQRRCARPRDRLFPRGLCIWNPREYLYPGRSNK